MDIEYKKDASSIKARIKKDKELMIEQLKKTPIVTLACEKVGIARATYYRWRIKDAKFTDMSDSAIREGISLVNDMAESQLLSSIKDGNMTGIIFWLKHHHNAYETRVEIRQANESSNRKLTKKQKEVIEKAIELAAAGEERA